MSRSSRASARAAHRVEERGARTTPPARCRRQHVFLGERAPVEDATNSWQDYASHFLRALPEAGPRRASRRPAPASSRRRACRPISIVRLLCVMTMNCERSRHLAHELVVAIDVRLVERRVDLVEDAERRRLDEEDRRTRARRRSAPSRRRRAGSRSAASCRAAARISTPALPRRRSGSSEPGAAAVEEARKAPGSCAFTRSKVSWNRSARGAVDLHDRGLELRERGLEVGFLGLLMDMYRLARSWYSSNRGQVDRRPCR